MSVLGMVSFIGLAVAIAIAISYRRVLKQRQRLWANLDEQAIKNGLDLLLKRGYDGATAILSDGNSGRFLQFRKYIKASGSVGLETHFPRAPWSRGYYHQVSELLVRLGRSPERIVLTGGDVVETLHADFEADTQLATTFVTATVREIFGSPAVRLTLHADDICPEDVAVISADHPRPFALLKKQLRGR